MGAKQSTAARLSPERRCAEALMMACDERLGAQSPAALMVCDTFLARDFWTSFVHQSYLPPAASQVWAWGNNREGQLGIGDTEDRTTPTEVTALHGRCIHAVACGTAHTMAVVDDGELWASGCSYLGQAGFSPLTNSHSFIRIDALSGRKVAAVACGDHHTLALLESGELFACGYNRNGELGLRDEVNRRTPPEPVTTLSGRRVVAIACGSCFSLAILETGELFAWGCSNHGQLGIGDFTQHSVPTQVTALAGRRVVAVACGEYHTTAVTEFGDLFSWGRNSFGQLGEIDLTTDINSPQPVEALIGRPVLSVACGSSHSLVLLESGEIFAFGSNREGQLGLGKAKKAPVSTPQQIHFFDSKHVKSIRCGGNASAAVLDSGELFVWGAEPGKQHGKRASPKAITLIEGRFAVDVTFGPFCFFALLL